MFTYFTILSRFSTELRHETDILVPKAQYNCLSYVKMWHLGDQGSVLKENLYQSTFNGF